MCKAADMGGVTWLALVCQIRKWSLFRPDDINDLYPFPRNRISYPGVDRIKGYRYPAPGYGPATLVVVAALAGGLILCICCGRRGGANRNQKDVHVPQSESDDRLFDIGYYGRDTR